MTHQPAQSTGVIFDLDGTLLDTLGDITASLNAVLEARGLHALPLRHVRDLVGEGLSRLLSLASGIEDDSQINELVATYRPEYARRMYDTTCLYPGVDRFLDSLAHAGIPLAVLSNKSHEHTEELCHELLGRWSFVGIRGQVPGGPRKPDPAAALELAAAMGRQPQHVSFVGDSDVDIETARNAGMTAIAVTWGYRNVDVLKNCRPAWIIDDPGELPRLILGERASQAC